MFDPRVFRPDAVDPETLKFNEELEKIISAAPPAYTLTPQALRELVRSGESVAGPIKRLRDLHDRVVPGPAGDVPIRVFVPDTVTGVYLHIHGGGWVIGGADQQDEALVTTGKECQVAVVSVEYRLAPENPYPAGPDDCEAAAVWLAEHAASEFGSDRLVIGGESAGGNLAAVTALRMRDRHGFRGFCGANLVYGCFDLSFTPSCRNFGKRPLLLDTPYMEWFVQHYVSADKVTDPDVSPLYADLSELPPALFTVGTVDPLLDDSLFMYARWLAAGNEATLAVHPGAVHAFDLFPTRLARQARDRVHEFIRQCVKSAG